MKINLLVTGGLYTSQAGYSAWRFCQAAVAAGHEISQVFFYQDGVTQGARLSMPLDDEFDAVGAWVDFSEQHSTPLIVCISAGERRAMMSDEQAQELAKGEGNIHSAFTVAGLGLLHEASLESDRMVTFG